MSRANYVVVEREDGWYVSFEHNVYGPCPGGRVGALITAVQAAQQAGKDGHDAQVLVREATGTLTRAWTFGTDPYPCPWAEEARLGAFPARGTARRVSPASIPKEAP